MEQRHEIILIGPIGTGKSTLARLLSEKLSIPRCCMDTLRWAYMKEVGYDEAVEKQIKEHEGWRGVFRYWKPFEAHMVERLLAEHPDCVIDFGASQSVYEDEADFARVQRALAPYPNVVLVLPSPDLDESVRMLKERVWDGIAGGFDFHEHFVKHPSNHRLARIVVYTKGRSPEETRDQILEIIARREDVLECLSPKHPAGG
jgi:broad-specificity NMP kinase